MPRHHPENSTKLVTLCESGDVGELALIKSLLDGNGIAYTVQHEHVLSSGLPAGQRPPTDDPSV